MFDRLIYTQTTQTVRHTHSPGGGGGGQVAELASDFLLHSLDGGLCGGEEKCEKESPQFPPQIFFHTTNPSQFRHTLRFKPDKLTRTADASASCSACAIKSAATNDAFDVSSATTRHSEGPARPSMRTCGDERG